MYTDNIQKEQFSRAYVRAIAALAKCTVGDYDVDSASVDITLCASIPDGKQTAYPQIDIQLKCTDQDVYYDDGIHFSLNLKNYNDLKARVMIQRMLVVVCVPKGIENWTEQDAEKLSLKKCGYWIAPSKFPNSDNKTAVTIIIPYENIFSVENLKQAMKNIADGGIL